MNIIAVTWALSDISRPPNILNTGSAPLVLMLCEMLSCGWGTTSHPSSWSRILSSAHLHHTLPSSNCVFDGWAIARISEIPPKTSIQPFEGELLINAPTGFPRASHMCALAVPWRSEFPRFSSFKNHPENIFENGGGENHLFSLLRWPLSCGKGQPGQQNWRSSCNSCSFHCFYLDWAFVLPVLHCL